MKILKNLIETTPKKRIMDINNEYGATKEIFSIPYII